MKRLTTITTLLLLALALAACNPDPPTVLLEVINDTGSEAQANACVTLRATLTTTEGTLEVGPLDPGESSFETMLAPTHMHGQPASIEAWCDTNTIVGYARLEGALTDLNAKINPIFVRPPDANAVCVTDLTASTAPTPCVTTNNIN